MYAALFNNVVNPFLHKVVEVAIHSLRDNGNRLSLALARADIGLSRLLVGNS